MNTLNQEHRKTIHDLNFWIPLLERDYDITIDKNKSFFIQDQINIIYLIQTTKGKFILRVSYKERPIVHTKEDYLYELNVLNYLSSLDFSVNSPLQTRSGKYLNFIEGSFGSYYYCLLNYIKGNVMIVEETDQKYLGKMIASLHKTLDNFESPYKRFHLDTDFLIKHPVEIIENFTEIDHQEKITSIKEIAEYISKYFNRISSKNNTHLSGIVHGD